MVLFVQNALVVVTQPPPLKRRPCRDLIYMILSQLSPRPHIVRLHHRRLPVSRAVVAEGPATGSFASRYTIAG